MTGFFSLTRLWAMFLKEFVQMRRDRLTFGMMLGIPIMQLVLFGYAINNDPRDLPAALVATGNDPYTRAIVQALEVSDYYRFTELGVSAQDADRMLVRGDVAFVVTIPSDLAIRMQRGDKPQLLVEADATDPASAGAAISALPEIARQAFARVNMTRPEAQEGLEVVVHRRYNPEAISQYNVVPGLLGVILQLTMVMMTAMALTREYERGTMENLLAMPATPAEIMLGKVLPYLGVGAVQVVVVLTAGRFLFDIPFVGSISLLLTTTIIFVLALVLLGYFISTVAKTQMQAMQMTFFFFLPSLLLSGFMFPFRGMPEWAQALGEFFPLTHFLRVIRGIMLKGAQWPDVAVESYALVAFVFGFALLALLRFKRTLD
ncbi:ABC transporter permease [Pseudovibrio exalbescens]|uniref:Transport permease protein n=1 Tax=Pseudovibrio exalbescens TaxID=197461 RepID=A0A1U7JCB8_9HYPH|nr:ABC transporter permease [Pseudovibrio exalbescens]OKL42400.1 mannose-1-phosphate guanyltransferase [Pseudovibrio exalbescens]